MLPRNEEAISASLESLIKDKYQVYKLSVATDKKTARMTGGSAAVMERGAGACAVRGDCVHLPPNQPARWGWAGSYLSVKRTFQAYLPSSNFATSRKNREETATGASALDVSSCAPGREPARHLCDIIWTWAGCALPILGKGNAKAGRWDRQEVQNPTSFVFRSACAGSREFCRPTMKVEAAPWYTSGRK